MKKKPFFIGIVGPSSAGKSSLCGTLKKGSGLFEHIKLDNYFKSPKTFPKRHGFVNWELPSNLQFDKLLSDLKKLKSGKIVETKTFPKKKGGKREPLTLHPKKYILVEGFALFRNKPARDFFDLKIYLDIPKRMMLKRRELHFGKNHVNDYANKVAIPEFLKNGITQKKYANYVVNADRPQSVVVQKIKKIIETTLLL